MQFTDYYARKKEKRFDLSKADFFSRKCDGRGMACKYDVGLTIGKSNGVCNVLLSLKTDTKKKISNARRVVIGIVKQNDEERLYVIDSDDGYKCSDLNSSTRKQAKITIGKSAKQFEKYIGYHNFKYDADNEAYYITAEE